MYGIGGKNPDADAVGRRCLLARKLVASGVRFVQVIAMGWDSHDYIEKAHGARLRDAYAIPYGWAGHSTAILWRPMSRRPPAICDFASTGYRFAFRFGGGTISIVPWLRWLLAGFSACRWLNWPKDWLISRDRRRAARFKRSMAYG